MAGNPRQANPLLLPVQGPRKITAHFRFSSRRIVPVHRPGDSYFQENAIDDKIFVGFEIWRHFRGDK
jgi:hypothetical protein